MTLCMPSQASGRLERPSPTHRAHKTGTFGHAFAVAETVVALQVGLVGESHLALCTLEPGPLVGMDRLSVVG